MNGIGLNEHLIMGEVRVHFADTGVGQPLLLRSGGPGQRDYLGRLAQRLATEVRVVRMDPRGCGDSTSDGSYDDGVTVQDMERLRIHLGIQRWVVAGHSHGAHQVLRYALAFPERVQGIICIAGVGLQRDRSWFEAYQAGLDRGDDQEVPPDTFQLNPEVHHLGSTSYAAFIRRSSLWKDIANLDVPFLAIVGDRDIRPDCPVRQLVELLPRARLMVVLGAPHALWYTHPETVSELIEQFVAGLGQ